jgi:hypothetical protein
MYTEKGRKIFDNIQRGERRGRQSRETLEDAGL